MALFSGSSTATNHYPPHAKSTETTVTVHVVWLRSYAEVDAFCAAYDNEVAKGTILACYLTSEQIIFAVEPESFNDGFGLSILGHEFWHALGATHP